MNDMDYSLGRPRQRRPNYTKHELEILIEKLEEKPEMYLGLTEEKYRGYTPEEVIRKGWDEVAEAVNAVGGYDRSGRELRAKWRDMKAKVKYKAQDVSAQPMSDIEQKIMDMLSRLAIDLPEESAADIFQAVAPVLIQSSPVPALVTVVTPNQISCHSEGVPSNAQQNSIHTSSSAQCISTKDHLKKDILELLQSIANDQAEIKDSVASIQTAVNEHAAVARQRLALEQKRIELEEKRLLVEERRVAAEERLLTLLVQGKVKIGSS